MSMYTEILEARLRDRPRASANMTTSEALSAVLDCRRHLGPVASAERGASWTAGALADQIAYDLALMDLVRCVGLACDPTSFDPPQHRRAQLEDELGSCGIQLDELARQSNSTSEHC